MVQFPFPKKEHLKSRTAIKYIFEKGRKKMMYPILFQYATRAKRTEADPPAVFGVTVSKKKAKKAVQRNRIKRQMREAYRLHPFTSLDNAEQQLCIMAVYVGDVASDFAAISHATVEFKKWVEKKYS